MEVVTEYLAKFMSHIDCAMSWVGDRTWLWLPLTLIAFFSLVTYFIPVFLQIFFFDFFPQNLKKKYNAEWALVTGASSGMGHPLKRRRAAHAKLASWQFDCSLYCIS
jgi:hypothetical protein